MMIACHHYFWGNVFGFSTRNEREREKLLTLYFLQKIRWFLLQNRPKFSCNLPLRRAAVLSRIKNASDFFCQITFDRWKRTRKTHLCDCDFRFSLYRFRALKWTMARSWKKNDFKSLKIAKLWTQNWRFERNRFESNLSFSLHKNNVLSWSSSSPYKFFCKKSTFGNFELVSQCVPARESLDS